jgi:hypothetical protein
MNITRLLSLAATFGITVIQWAICLALFLYAQPVTAVSPKFVHEASQSAIPEIVVIGHRS